VPADKRRARLNVISHMLAQIPYSSVKVDLPKIPKAQSQPKDVEGGLWAANIVPNRF
jgi:polyphosphate kinase